MVLNNNKHGNEQINGLFVEHFKEVGFMAREKPDYTNLDKKINSALYDLMIKRDANSIEV